MTILLPTFEEADAACAAGRGTPIDEFISNQEPAGPDETLFRGQLQAALDFAAAGGATPLQQEAARALVAVARTAHTAADNSEERSGASLIDGADFKVLCESLDRLQALPDDKPGYVMSGPAKAEWALQSIIDPKPAPECQRARSVHHWFELTYAQFLTLPRVVMEAMPMPWQHKMTALLDELGDRWNWLPANGNMYYVRVGQPVEWPYEDDDGNPIEPVLYEPDADLCDYRHPRIEHRRKTQQGEEKCQA